MNQKCPADKRESLARLITQVMSGALAFVNTRVSHGRTLDEARADFRGATRAIDTGGSLAEICRRGGMQPAQAAEVDAAVTEAIVRPGRRITSRDIRRVWPNIPLPARRAVAHIANDDMPPHEPRAKAE